MILRTRLWNRNMFVSYSFHSISNIQWCLRSGPSIDLTKVPQVRLSGHLRPCASSSPTGWGGRGEARSFLGALHPPLSLWRVPTSQDSTPRSSQVAWTIGSFLEMAYSPVLLRAENPVETNTWKTLGLTLDCLIEKGWYILVITNRSFFSILSKRPVYIISGFDAPPVQYHEKLPWQIPGKKPLPPRLTLLHFLTSHPVPPAGAPLRSPAHSAARRHGQKWNGESCHSSDLPIPLTYDMIDFPSECSNLGSSSCPSHGRSSERIQPWPLGQGKRLTCGRATKMNTDEIWKRNFPSVNHLSKGPANHRKGDPERGRPRPWLSVPRGPWPH